MLPVAVSELAPTAAAMPKSITLTSPRGVIITLAGFTSRWTSPERWAASSAAATSAAIRAASSGGSRPRRCSADASVSPSTSSITRKATWPGRPALPSSP